MNAQCDSCKTGSPRLSKRERDQAKKEFRRPEAAEEVFRAALNQKNEPEEEYLCSIAPESLDYKHARRLQELWGNLEKVLKYYLEVHPNNGLDARRARLRNAILNVPDHAIQVFTNEEILTQMEILQTAFPGTGNEEYLHVIQSLENLLEEFVAISGITPRDRARISALYFQHRQMSQY